MTDWFDSAACKGMNPEIFFTERGGNDNTAKRICANCPVQEPCLEFAIVNNEEFGRWGNTSPRQRRKIRRERGLAGPSTGPRATHGSWTMAVIKHCACDPCQQYSAALKERRAKLRQAQGRNWPTCPTCAKVFSSWARVRMHETKAHSEAAA